MKPQKTVKALMSLSASQTGSKAAERGDTFTCSEQTARDLVRAGRAELVEAAPKAKA